MTNIPIEECTNCDCTGWVARTIMIGLGRLAATARMRAIAALAILAQYAMYRRTT